MNKRELPIKSPCTQDWNTMEGGDRQRYCRQCDKQVHNLSAMTREDAQAILQRRQKGQRLCVRYSVGAAGDILFQRQPLIPAGLLLRTRQVALRATLAAAALAVVAEQPGCVPAGPVTGAVATRAAAEEVVDKLAEDGTCAISLEPLLPLSLTFHAAACAPPAPPAEVETFVGQAPAPLPPPAPAETTTPPPAPEPPAPPPPAAETARAGKQRAPRSSRKAALKPKPPEPSHVLMGDIAID